jgi:flagellar motor switch protein FliN
MSDIKNFDIRTRIIDAIVDVFNSMVSMEVELYDAEPSDTTSTDRMVATVNFAGNVGGIINIQVDSALSRLMMAGKLDVKPEEVEDDGEVKNLLAEIGNIVGGSLKSSLSDAGHRCVISAPSITYGADFSIKPLKMERFERFIFNHQENYIFVEVGLTTQQASSDGDESAAPDARAQLSDADIAKINALDINARVSEATIDVFDTKLSLKLESADAATAEGLEGIRNVGSVCFAGDATGMVSIHAGDSFSREMAAAMLGMEVEKIEGDEQIRDVLGEIGNIVGGSLKSAFTDAGLRCALSTPSFTSGTEFQIEALDMESYERFAFRCGKNIIFVEMGVKVSELVQSDPRQGKDIHYAVGDDTTHDDAPAPTKEGEGEPITTASDPTIPEQPDLPAEADAAKAAENVPVETQDSKTPEDFDLDLLLDIPLEINVELGRARIKVQKLLNLNAGSAVKLIKLEGEPVDILVNETLIARGEVIVQNEKYGIRVTEITSRMDRIRSFGI